MIGLLEWLVAKVVIETFYQQFRSVIVVGHSGGYLYAYIRVAIFRPIVVNFYTFQSVLCLACCWAEDVVRGKASCAARD